MELRFISRLVVLASFLIGSAFGGACGGDDDVTPDANGRPPGVTATAPPAASPPRIALTVTTARLANSDIYVVRADGSGLTRLTEHQGFDGAHVWSPDGTQIAFMSDRGGQPLTQPVGIYLMSADGTNQRRISDVAAQLGSLAWSPDGTRLAFAALAGQNWEIFTVGIDGSGLSRLTTNDAYDDSPVWSPDGRRIAFVSQRGRTSNIPNFMPQDIYVMNADGSATTRVNVGEEFERSYSAAPSWSPDGRRIAFYSDGPGGSAINTVNSDGTNLVRLATGPGSVSRPAWSPDGRILAFYSLAGSAWEIQAVNADGSGQRRVTDQAVAPPAFERPIAWSPDGRRIAFVSDQPPGSEVYLVNVDGSGLTRLLQAGPGDTLFSGWPVWSPR